MSPNDEYGVYERLAVLETKLSEMERQNKNSDFDRRAPAGILGIPNQYIVWAILTATALGSGPNVLDLLTRIVLK